MDGQHRVVALDDLITEDETAKQGSRSVWRDFTIPFVCLLGATPNEEMMQFYVVNSRAKSVPTDLAYTLLTKHAKSSDAARRQLLESGDAWKIAGQEIAERLTEIEPWLGRIRFPSQKKTRQMTIPSSGMVNSLRELVRGSSPVFEQAELDGRTQLLSAYWRGILRVLPDANDDPSKFTIQKMTGAVLMHSVLPNVLELVRARYGNSGAVNPEAYQELMENPLLKLEGENREGHIVNGIDFWRSGADGAAGAFSSNAGRRQLRARILRELPPLRFD